ncbi:hypothetical protein CBR_g48663 [Chara braunii]|uniref:Uncharacterized protein n=1 Tax=Chara braunii TaxID=69332 RepID=A0A388K4E6_CHABU|nr:hypothetical protein CBR_g48663 [Chara braunii]|eukprot:GBG64915.1 hypothetical protein CBR_g48663 [Chara braunii]
MSFITEWVLDAQLRQPRDHISEIRQVCHPRLSTDLRRLMRFFCDEGICAAAVFRIEGSPHAIVFAEVTAVHRRAGPRTSHVTTVAGFTGDISSVNPLRHTAILASLRECTEQELIAPIVQLADDLSPDIYFQSDNSPAPYIFERSLDPYLQWTSCLEEPRDEDTLPSRQEYLKPYEIIPYAFYPRAEEVVIDDNDDEEEDDDEEAPPEGSYSEHSEGELSEEEEEEEGIGSEWEAPPEEATHTGTEAEDPEAARKREEIASGKRQLAFASEASLRISSDPTRNPEPPRPEDGDPTAATSSIARRR